MGKEQQQSGKLSNSVNFEQNLIAALADLYDSSSVECSGHESLMLNLDGKSVHINLKSLLVKCDEDENLEQNVTTIIKQLKDLS